MRLDTANRSFFTLVGVALGPYLLLGVFGCGALSMAIYRLMASGPAAVADGADGWAALGFLTVAAGGAVAALRSTQRQHAATRQLAAFVRSHQLPVTGTLASAAARAGLPTVGLIESELPYAFTYGALAPRVVVSSQLLKTATADELDAILVHERYHVANLDPLKVVVARALPAAFFFLPALGHLRQRYLASRELAADRRAVRTSGARPLAGALYKVASGPTPSLVGAAAAIGGNDLLEVRLAQLEAGAEPPLPTVPRRALAFTALGLLAMAGGMAATVTAATPTGMVGTGGGSPDVIGGLVCGVLWLAAGIGGYRRFAASR